ncbi:MAG: hypothetical protein KAQ66_07815 [Rhodospirillaceae bacterium]|nr:hypothetical protein [Rhodospirillaceae bacterium]
MARPPSSKPRKTALPGGLQEILFEFRPVGNILRVTAIDPKTGTEVIMVADPRYGEEAIKRLAARKLAYVISKKKGSQSGENSGDMLV